MHITDLHCTNAWKHCGFLQTTTMLLALALALLPASHASADAFVLRLTTPAFDDAPTVQIGATVGGAQVNVPAVIIDTGAGLGLYVTSASATTLGLNLAAGTPAAAGGVGGTATTTQGVPMPAGTAPTGPSAPITPPGQTAATPALPGTTTVGPLPAGVGGLIGSGFLADYNYGRIKDGGGSFFYLSTKAQGAQGAADALAIASALAYAAPFLPGSDGRPAGTRNNIIVPTPSQNLPSGQLQYDNGFNIDVDLINPSGNTLQNASFIIRSGLPMTLISQDIALSLGLSLGGLPSVPTLGNFGTIQVLLASLELALFDDPGFPRITIPVGITDPSINPFGVNLLGGDVLGLLPYWEVFQDATGQTRFFAAATVQVVPESPTVFLLIVALPGILWSRRRSRAAREA